MQKVPYTERAVPLDQRVCGNCRHWPECDGQPNPSRFNNPREKADTACFLIWPVTIDGVEIPQPVGG